MPSALIPPDESSRLQELRSYDVLDSLPEAALDDLTRLASYICQTPMALITLVDESRQWFKSVIGLEGTQTSRDAAFCAHAILGKELFVVADALKDDRFFDNPFVTGEPGVRFYAGSPLISESGHALGSLCVIDRVPRTLTATQARALEVLSRQAMTHLTMHRTMLHLKKVEGELQLAKEALEARVVERTAQLTIANGKLADSNEELATDIHRRQLAEQSLRESEAQFRFLAETMPTIIFTATPDGNIDYYNPRWYDYTGLTFDQAKDWGWTPVIHPDDLQNTIERWTRCVMTGALHEVECRCKRGCDGEYRWHLARSSPRRDESGAIVQWVGNCTDIHDQKMAAAAIENARHELESRVEERTAQLQHEKQFAEAVLDNITDGIVACDASGTLTLFNRATRELHGMSEARIPAEDWSAKYDLFLADGITRMEKSEIPLYRAFEGEVVQRYEMVIAPHAKPKRRIVASGRPIHDSNGRKLGAVVGMNDITDRAAAEEKFRVVFECSSDAHLLHDDTGIIDCNNAALEMLGCRDKAQLLSLHPASLSPEFQPDGRRSIDLGRINEAAAFRDGQLRFEWMHQKLDGTPLPTEVTLTRVSLSGKASILVVWHDLTEQYKIQESLRLAKEAAELATRTKSEFLANMSHEIRTPMTAILGYADLLQGPARSDHERINYIQIIRRNGEQLLQILNDILDISKIEAGKLEVEHIPCSPMKILSEVEALMRGRAIEKNISFGIEYRANVPGKMRSDPTRIRQILINLISNAIKFTAAGEVKVKVSVENEGLAPRVRFDVVDTGIGLTAEQQTRLFLPFGQADSSTTRRFGGTGLGLAICHRLAMILGGEMSVTTEAGRGSTFSFSLPLTNQTENNVDDPGNATLIASAEMRSTVERTGARILLAEDGEDNRRLVTIYLKNAGFVVDAVPDGRAAVNAIVKAANSVNAYDLILMDMQMPVLDGYGATRELRQLGYTALPIVALTAHAMEGEKEKCIASGCDDYATKPLDPVALLQTLRRRLNTPGLETIVNTDSDGRNTTEGEVRSSRENDPILSEILIDYVANLPVYVSEMASLLARSEMEDLRQLVHQLKGSGGGYGFAKITHLAAIAEARIANRDTVLQLTAEIQELSDYVRRVAGYDRSREKGIAPANVAPAN